MFEMVFLSSVRYCGGTLDIGPQPVVLMSVLPQRTVRCRTSQLYADLLTFRFTVKAELLTDGHVQKKRVKL